MGAALELERAPPAELLPVTDCTVRSARGVEEVVAGGSQHAEGLRMLALVDNARCGDARELSLSTASIESGSRSHMPADVNQWR